MKKIIYYYKKISNILAIPLLIIAGCSLLFKETLDRFTYINESRYMFFVLCIVTLIGLFISFFSKK